MKIKGRKDKLRVRDNAHKKEERRDVCHCFSSQWFGHQAGTLMHCNVFFKLWAGLKLCLVPETGMKIKSCLPSALKFTPCLAVSH